MKTRDEEQHNDRMCTNAAVHMTKLTTKSKQTSIISIVFTFFSHFLNKSIPARKEKQTNNKKCIKPPLVMTTVYPAKISTHY